MKFFLFLVAVFASHFALADGCRIGQTPWTSGERVTGYGECRGYNFNQTACIKPPVEEDAMNMANEIINQRLVSCKFACDASGGKFSHQLSAANCELVKGQSSVFDYYKCSMSAAIACN